MKRVSFELAKALKKVGYPQCGDWWYSENGGLSDDWLPGMMFCSAPYILEVWLWMWRERHEYIECNSHSHDYLSVNRDGWKTMTFAIRYDNGFGPTSGFMSKCDANDPEQAIENALNAIF